MADQPADSTPGRRPELRPELHPGQRPELRPAPRPGQPPELRPAPRPSHDRGGDRRYGVPTVVVDDLHVVYRIYGATGGSSGNATSALRRMLLRQGEPSYQTVHAVKGVTFSAHRGEAIGIIGSNGSGKTTLLKAIAGLLPAERGKVYTDGQPSLLGVNAALMNDLTGERNVILGSLAMGMSQDDVRTRYEGIVDFSGINEKGDFISLPMRTYSSGMAARLRFSIAAAKTHEVLLIDEALATGDAQFKVKSQKRIEELRKDAGAVFLVAHQLDVVKETCDRVIWIDDGRMIMDGDAEEVVGAYIESTKK